MVLVMARVTHQVLNGIRAMLYHITISLTRLVETNCGNKLVPRGNGLATYMTSNLYAHVFSLLPNPTFL